MDLFIFVLILQLSYITCSFSCMSHFRKIFIAYIWPVSFFWTNLTSPKAPRPMTFSDSKSSHPSRDLFSRRNSVSFCACWVRFSRFWRDNKKQAWQAKPKSATCLGKKALRVAIQYSRFHSEAPLKALFNNVFTFKILNCMSLHTMCLW